MKTQLWTKLTLLFGVALAVVGCEHPRPAARSTSYITFDSASHEIYRKEGTGAIKGQGFLRQRGGGTVTCAGSPVYALPDTPFFREVVAAYRAGSKPMMSDFDKSVLRSSQCDAQGNFAFTRMPSARWMLFTEVSWTVRYSRQGGTLMKVAQPSPGETVNVLLTDADFIGR